MKRLSNKAHLVTIDQEMGLCIDTVTGLLLVECCRLWHLYSHLIYHGFFYAKDLVLCKFHTKCVLCFP